MKKPKPVVVVIGEEEKVIIPKARGELGPGSFQFYFPDAPFVWRLGRVIGATPSGKTKVQVEHVGAGSRVSLTG